MFITGPNGELLTNDEGKWLLYNTVDNTILEVEPQVTTNDVMQNPEIVATSDNSNLTDEALEMQMETTHTDSEDHFGEKNDGGGRWTRPAILTLIDLYKEHITSFKSTSVKNEHVWNEIRSKMEKHGFAFSKKQIENKFKYLKGRYIRKKDNITRGTGESPILFDYFSEFEEIFGKSPNVVPVALASSSSSTSNCTFSSTSNSSSEDNEEPKQKKRRTRLEKEIESLATILAGRDEKTEEARERRHRERQQMGQEALQLYSTLMEKLIDKL